MTEDAIQIDHGGAIAVDTDVLRDVVARVRRVAAQADAAALAARRAHALIVDGTGLSAAVDTVALWATADRIGALRTRMDEVVVGIGLMADAFELVEARAQRAALAVADSTAARDLDARIAALSAKDPRLADMAAYLEEGWRQERFEGLAGQFDLLEIAGLNPGVITAAASLVGASSGLGKLRPGQTLEGRADPVTVRPVRSESPVAPPAGLAEAFRRFPHTAGAQVKVERYAFADGSSRFVLYATGTRSGLFGAGEPWDMRSNLELYTSRTSASYRAAVEALRRAGARPGDAVDVFAHSQAGMIAAHLAMDSEFDVPMVVTAGSPVEPTLRDDQLLIQLRHTDDLVNALAGGGSPDGTGSPDSFVAHREGDPEDRLGDLVLAPHRMAAYIETAEMVDRSTDVRADAYRERLRELGDAVAIEATEFDADRVG